MNEPHELRQRALRWLRWAEEDLVTAQTLLDAGHVVPRGACSAAHQAAEKALKSLLVDADVDPPKTHDLGRLCGLVGTTTTDLDESRLADLSRWSIEGRYPADLAEATRHDARQAVQFATEVVGLSATVLAMEPGTR